jgi:hypothetical protein
VNSDDRPVRNADAAGRRIDDLSFVMNPERSELHSFNDVGMRVWELVDGERTVADIAAAIVDEFEVEPGVAEADALEFLALLRERDLIRC